MLVDITAELTYPGAEGHKQKTENGNKTGHHAKEHGRRQAFHISGVTPVQSYKYDKR